jgi:hypothetical protein
MRARKEGRRTVEPMLTKRQRQKVASEVQHLVGPCTTDADMRVIKFVAAQVGRQSRGVDAELSHRRGVGEGGGASATPRETLPGAGERASRRVPLMRATRRKP